MEFAKETLKRNDSKIRTPDVVGAVIDMDLCLDLATSSGIEWVKTAYDSFFQVTEKAGGPIPRNSSDLLLRNLDCAVITHLHQMLAEEHLPSIDIVRGIFTEGGPIYEDAGFFEKTHVRIAVRNLACIKGVVRVPVDQLQPLNL